MAVYRSDQAQLTFAAEAAPGGDIELNSAVAGATPQPSSAHNSYLVEAAPAGQRFVTLSAVTNAEVGQHIKIGPATSTSAFTINRNSEIRRIEYIDGTTLWLDRPLGFFHKGASGSWAAATHDITMEITEIAAAGINVENRVITQIPGLYETVDTPDPEMAIEPRYFLGTESKRNFFTTTKGQQTYTGSISGIIPVNAMPFRFPIGSMVDQPGATTTSPNFGGSNRVVKVAGTARKGNVWVEMDAAVGTQGINAGDVLYFGNTGDDLIGTATEDAVYQTAVVAQACTVPVDSGDPGPVQLTTPLRFDIPDNTRVFKVTPTADNPIVHHIFEQVVLDSVSWHVHMKDSGETEVNNFDRRYYGGKIGATTITAEEGGMLTMGWDGVNFLGMVHNQQKGNNFSAADATTAVDLPFYSLMQTIDASTLTTAGTFPTDDPYFFSQGQVKIFGETIATIRSFSLSISNNEEPRYYVSRQLGKHRGPTKIEEQRREYGLSVSLALPDSGAASTARKTLWSELLLEGDYGAGQRGFNVELSFVRATGDTLTIRIPDDYNTSTGTVAAQNFTGAQTGGNEQGAFIRTAPHSITGDNPFQVEADIFFRNMKMEISDLKGDYV
mgnify:FL=1